MRHETDASIEPLYPDFTLVNVFNENGTKVMTGGYVHICSSVQCVAGYNSADDYHHCVLTKTMTDWSFPEKISISEVTPPHTIEAVEEEGVEPSLASSITNDMVRELHETSEASEFVCRRALIAAKGNMEVASYLLTGELPYEMRELCKKLDDCCKHTA